jgi:hypothetical protein
VFYGTRISPRMSRDNAGNLICHSAVIARSGKQQYSGWELGLGTDDVVEVYRSPREVLSPATIASANGKLITDNHPPTFLAPWNAGVFAKGHVSNAREGPVLENGDRTIIADLVIYDDNLISKILDGGLREISAGYDTEYVERADNTLEQRKIRINHVALVYSGRCGAACRVHDHDHKEQLMTKAERAQLDEAMRLVRAINEAFRAQVQDCDKPQADDRDFGKRAKEFHRGGKPSAPEAPRTVVNDSEESYESLIARYRRQRWGR